MASLQPKFSPIDSLAFLILLIVPITLCNACASFSQAGSESEVIADLTPIAITDVVAFGKLLPKGEVISLSVANAEDSRVNKVLVEEGDWVKAGQIVAILQGIDRKKGDLAEAEKKVVLQAAKLKKIKSGDAKESEIAAQEAVIARLQAQLEYESRAKQAIINGVEAELAQAELSYQRKDALQKQGAISQEESDRAREQLDVAAAILNQRKAESNNTTRTLEKQITEEQKNLARLKEVRPVDVEIAEAELAMAQVAVQQRQADLEDTQVRVPVAGRILRINTRVGERVDTEEGIIELGQTNEMYAIAEIYETEVNKIRIGQKATIESEYGGFTGKITGEVTHIGLQVSNRTLAGNSADPTNDENARVVEVKIRISDEDSEKVANLTNMQVQVSIDTAEESANVQDNYLNHPNQEVNDIELKQKNTDKTINNPNPINLLSLGVGLFGLVSFATIFKVKSQSQLKPHTANNSLIETNTNSDRQTLYSSSKIEQLRTQLYNKARKKQVAIATAKVELKQIEAEYLCQTSNLPAELLDPDKLKSLKQKFLLRQNAFAKQESQLDFEINDLRRKIAQTQKNLMER
ncbi:MAG: HlyD family efflux transporter periplasmic adaptor subunit [Cyanobacteria bacterium P01_G01_bin.39]